MIAQALAMGTLLGAMLAFLAWVTWKILDTGKTTILLADADAPTWPMLRKKIRGNEFTHVINGKKQRFILEAAAQRRNKKGAVYLVHPRTGWNMLPYSTADQSLDGKLGNKGGLALAELMVTNPRSYFQAIQRNELEDTLGMNSSEKKGLEALAPWAFGMLVVVMMMVGGILWMLQKGREAGA